MEIAINIKKLEKPLLNSLVLENLFQFFDGSDLKQLRTVHSVWNAEATLWLKERTTATIYYKPPVSSSNRMFRRTIFKNNVEAFKQEMTIFSVINMKLTSLNIGTDNSIDNYYSDDEETINEVTTIFQKMECNLKFLHIDLGLFFPESSQLLVNILNATSVQKLRKLSLNVTLGRLAFKLWETFPITRQLENVQELEIIIEYGTFYSYYSNEKISSKIAEKLLKLVPNLNKISVQRARIQCNRHTSEINTLINAFLETLKKQTNIKQVLLPLEKIAGNLNTYQCPSYFLPTYITYITYTKQLISNDFKIQLTRLEIDLPSIRNDAELLSIQKMFGHHAPTLVHLKFTIPFILVPQTQRYLDIGIIIRLPIFPKLKILSVKNHQGNFSPGLKPTFGLRFKFLSGKPNYKNFKIQFPTLTELSLGEVEQCSMHLCYKDFFPCAAIFYGVKRVSWMHEVYVDNGKLIELTRGSYLTCHLLPNIQMYINDAKRSETDDFIMFHQQLEEWSRSFYEKTN